MYNNGRTNVLDREDEKTQSKFDSDRIFGIRDDADDETVLVRKSGMAAETPVKDKEETVNLTPSSTTMQFESDDENDIFEEIPVDKVRSAQKKYEIHTKGKVLIAVYALVVATIVSLTVINSRMLKNLDKSISGYSSKITELTEQYEAVEAKLDYVRSDEVIGEKAKELGMTKK